VRPAPRTTPAQRAIAPERDTKHAPRLPARPAQTETAWPLSPQELRSRRPDVPAAEARRDDTVAGALDCLGLFRRRTPTPAQAAARIRRDAAVCLRSSCWSPSPIQSARLERLVASLGAWKMNDTQLAACLAGLTEGEDTGARCLAIQVFLRAFHPGTLITPTVFDRLLAALAASGVPLDAPGAGDVLRQGVRALMPQDRPAALCAWLFQASDSEDPTAPAQVRGILRWACHLECAESMTFAVAARAMECVDKRPLDLLLAALAQVSPTLLDAMKDDLADVPEALELASAFLPQRTRTRLDALPGEALDDASLSSLGPRFSEVEDSQTRQGCEG